MNLWGVAPLFAIALLGGGSGAHMTAANHTIHRSAAQSRSIRNSAQHRPAGRRTSTPDPSPTPSAVPPVPSAPSPVLRQVGPEKWETTVLLNDTGPACQEASTAGYLLAITSPYKSVPADSHYVRTEEVSPTSKPPKGSSCQVKVTFTMLAQTPETATLVINQAGMSSSITLIVSRDVTLTYYLGIPAIAGGVMAVLLWFVSQLIKVYDWDGKNLRRFSPKWRQRPILGSGAWALNDSWATNISTGLVVVATVLTATAAANSLFPGVALDRFAIVNIVAGAIVVAAPLVFGIRYAMFTARNPGPTADATVKLPGGAAGTIELPSGASITMTGDATVGDNAGHQASVRAGCTYQVPPGTKIDVQAGGQAVLQAVLQAVVQAVTLAAMLAATKTGVGRSQQAINVAIEEVTEQEPVWTVAQGAARAAIQAVTQADAQAAALADAQAAALAVVQAAGLADVQAAGLADVQAAVLAVAHAAGLTDIRAAQRAGVQAGVQAFTLFVNRDAIRAVKRVRPRQAARALRRAVKWRMVKRRAVRAVEPAVPERVTGAAVQAVVVAAAQPVPHAGIAEAVEAAAQAVAQEADAQPGILEAVRQAVKQQAVEAMAFPGTADIGVRPGSILKIQAPVGGWTIQASDQLIPPPPPQEQLPQPLPPAPVWAPWWWPPAPPTTTPADVHITYPASIKASGGAKITVVGTADVTFPERAVITAPRRRVYPLRQERKLLAPQGANVLVANMGMLLLANIFTMFGIGAELGIAGVLAYLSEATQFWRVAMFCGIGALALLVFVYAKTAMRTMADPQPGSSISAQAGTSFTL